MFIIQFQWDNIDIIDILNLFFYFIYPVFILNVVKGCSNLLCFVFFFFQMSI